MTPGNLFPCGYSTRALINRSFAWSPATFAADALCRITRMGGPRARSTVQPRGWTVDRTDLRVGGGEREGQRLRVDAGAQRVPFTDRLLEADGGRVVARRAVPHLQRGRR